MARRYLVVSDLHLADIEDHPDGWMAHKHSTKVFDRELDEAVAAFEAGTDPGDQVILVLNGDIFDFDLITAIPDEPAWPVSRRERVRGLDPTAAKSAWKLARILDQHPTFVSTIARLVSNGHEVVHIAGNHDTELHFTEVREVFADAVAARARSPEAPRVRFERWFYYVPNEIYVEHGHQYDDYSSVVDVLDPIDAGVSPPEIALSMGNVTNRTLMGRMGYFNPHASDYILSTFGYLKHWLKHYAFTRRSLLLVWLLGSLSLTRELLFGRRPRSGAASPESLARLEATATRTGLSLETLSALNALRRPPITTRAFRVVRELWIDRVIMALLMTAGTVALALTPTPLWVSLMVPLCGFPLLYLIYEAVVSDDGIYGMARQAQNQAQRIARLLPVRVVTFGHSHVPEHVPLAPGVWYVNTGTWAPMVQDPQADTQRSLRNALRVIIDGNEVNVRLETHQASA